MTSHNLSTSSSDFKRYLAAGVISFVCAISLVMAVSFYAIRHGLIQWQFAELLSYQLDKLRSDRPIDVLLVGDSSLGNAVDARQWSTMLQMNVVSLALTGAYGLDGSLNMIRRAARHHSPKAIIIMQTGDIMNRDRQPAGNVFTAENFSENLDIGFLGLIQVLANWDILSGVSLPLNSSSHDRYEEFRKSDYVPQSTPLPAKMAPPRGQGPRMVGFRNQNLSIIRKIAQECRRIGARCLFMYGPIFDPICKNSIKYRSDAEKLIADNGLPASPYHLCLPWQDVGDSMDHVTPLRKEFYSAQILEAVTPFIRNRDRQ
jgi:hypothetical protein